jgi:hypothetical protein
MRLKLKHDFGHRNYRNAHTYYLLEKGKGNMSVDPPQEPYNPVLQSIGLCYRATASYTASSIADPDTEALQWLHIAPFGDAQQHVTTSTDGSVYVLPQLVSAGSIGQAQGSLFIGMQGAIPGDVVSLLCQVMEGSEDPLANPPEEHVHWHYLKGNNWKELNKDAVNDGTDQLKRSGIIAITLPGDADNANTLLDPGYLWVRAAVTTLPEGVSKIMGIHANAIAVTRLLIANNAAANLVQPAGSIAKMEAPDGKVKKVNQPYASFGGRAVESGNEYYLRVSERLRHKDRAVTVWDYEHLVLQQFPEIYKAKCLNHTKLTGSGNSIDYNEVAPGWVTLITIPNLQQRNDADPLKPFTKAATLDAIADFLKARTSCHVQLVTAQPQFEEVRLSATVVLAEGYEDINYYGALLQQELTQYLSPWAFGGGTSLDFGGSLHKSVLIDFIEERPYVDYITDVKLYHKPGENATESGDVEAAVASTARSILVSAAASKHDFDVKPPTGFIEQTIPCQNNS